MGDFLQLNVKRRQKEGGFLDLLKEEFDRGCKDDLQNSGDALRERVRTWLVEDGRLGGSPYEPVDPFDIVAVVMNRVCEIAGHAWIEFVEGASDDSIRGAGEARQDRINAYVAEFVSNFDLSVDHTYETFEAAEGSKIPWHQITEEQLCRLFAPLFAESTINRTNQPATDRPPAGAVPGDQKLFSPAQVREQDPAWRSDRREAYVTPVWEVAAPHATVDSIRKENVELRYSYTPEHYEDTENCVTWASRVLDAALAPGDWLETIRVQCFISPELAPERCEDYHIREHGRMRCTEGYVSLADVQRETGLRRFK